MRSIALALLLVVTVGPAKATPRTLTDAELKDRVQACILCHGEQGRAGPDGYFPRIAGKPAGYLYNQLIAFRDGGRVHAAMNNIVQPLSNAALWEMASYFSAQHPPYPNPAPSKASTAELELGKQIVTQGLPGKQVPACVNCHAAGLMGVEPYTPGLLGLPRDYLTAQIGKWMNGQRHAAEPDCMGTIITALSNPEINAATAYLASRPVPKDTTAAPAGSVSFPMECGTHTQTAKPTTHTVSPEPVELSLLTESEKRGAYLARAGNCMGCHTSERSKPYAGGKGIQTPFGIVYTSNLTPAANTGLGKWTADDFYKAMHEGISKNGHYLYPAFPFTSYTRMTRQDVHDLYQYLRRIKPVEQATPKAQMTFPFKQRQLMTVWRALYFRGGEYTPDPRQTAQWNRGAYLVNGPGHCAACHTPRNSLGGLKSDQHLGGGTIPVLNWFAPALNAHPRDGLGQWSISDLVDYLGSGKNRDRAVTGPMSEVVAHSLQFLNRTDLEAMAVYLKSLPAQSPDEKSNTVVARQNLEPLLRKGETVYQQHCVDCHGSQGEGKTGAYPRLAGNSGVIAPNPANAIRMVLNGGFSPSTRDNPVPHGMPPYRGELSDADVAAVVSYVRQSWGNSASAVSGSEVNRLRSVQ
ncbi:c-type cytochrome [Limnobacter humi]|uniref:C-type cytochrome n=1 Tax=Limnobacter humi TaxID=1778671 RepID=A0ABT1WGQ1_9BURK|nr:c-type cytochrome [Limnobacter humi]MCQ8896689.1 c-type cytochrome [Limnobacter humi]